MLNKISYYFVLIVDYMVMIKLIRISLGYLIVFLNFIFSPKQKKRTNAEQERVNFETQKLTLYEFHLCPFCVRVRRTMHRLNLSIELKDARYNSVHKDELLNGGGKVKVPCLRIETESKTTWLYESKSIILYLNEHFS